MAERDLIHSILTAYGSRPDTLIYRVQPIRMGRMLAAPVGHSDLLACVAGRYVAIEAKSATGRQRPEQAAFQAAVERAGGVYVLARSLSDVKF